MKPALYTILLIFLMPAIFSCKKKKAEAPVEVSTDSLYLQAVVDSFTFTAATTTGVYSGQSSYWVSTKAYLQIVARTGPDSTDGTISIRLDNWPHQTGEYVISSLHPNNKASYAKTDKKIETADSGRVTITEIGKAVKGRFYFYTKNHQVSSGYFSAQ